MSPSLPYADVTTTRSGARDAMLRGARRKVWRGASAFARVVFSKRLFQKKTLKVKKNLSPSYEVFPYSAASAASASLSARFAALRRRTSSGSSPTVPRLCVRIGGGATTYFSPLRSRSG